MRVLFFLLFIITTQFGTSQSDYFNGKRTYCEFIDDDSKKKYELGIMCIAMWERYGGTAVDIFMDLAKKDSTFCDAYFFLGYSLRLLNREEDAVKMYYIADSLANNKSIEFKQNLAVTAGRIGYTNLSRKKYQEMIEYFPYSPEGYYGVGASSLFLGDYENGLNHINDAIHIYEKLNKTIGDEVYFNKAVLLTLLGRFEQSMSLFDKIKSRDIIKEDMYKVYYSYSLIKIGKKRNDNRMIKKAKKLKEKVNDLSLINDNLSREFNE